MSSVTPADPADPAGAVRLVDIRDTPLDVAEVCAALDDPGSGGVTLFVGRVRDHDHAHGDLGAESRPVVGLGYSAHPSALERLREVCAQVASDHGVQVAAVHRVGDLAIGDIAVVVAAGAGHRGDAFTAARDLIDSLKQQVPIWKHQLFADGTDEWVGTP